MGFWKEKIKDPFNAWLGKHPWAKTTWQVATHPTTARIIILAVVIALAPFTGGASIMGAGAALAIFKISVIFTATLISVVAKAIQLRRVENLKLQRGLTKAIAEKQKALETLGRGRERLFSTLGVGDFAKQYHVIDITTPSKTKSFLKTLRDVGTENILAVIATSAATGATGGLLFLSLGSGMFFITGEFKERLAIDREKARMKAEINEACKSGNIRSYKNLEELHRIFREKMIEYESVERMAEIYDQNPQMTEKDIQKIYGLVRAEVEERIGFNNIPAPPNFWKSTWHAVRPWGKRYATPEYTIPVDDIVGYRNPFLENPTELEKPVKLNRELEKQRLAEERNSLEEQREAAEREVAAERHKLEKLGSEAKKELVKRPKKRIREKEEVSHRSKKHTSQLRTF